MKKKEFDAVLMMRRIRERLSATYTNPRVEEKDLEKIRKKYGIII
jgi:hypothetical protein